MARSPSTRRSIGLQGSACCCSRRPSPCWPWARRTRCPGAPSCPRSSRSDGRAGGGELEAPAPLRARRSRSSRSRPASRSRSPAPRACWCWPWSPTPAATLAALRIPRTQVAAAPATAAESAELRGVGVRLAASAMGLVRGIVGFLTFLLLFELRDGDTWKLGAVLLLTGRRARCSAPRSAPALRRSFPEERMLTTLLAVAVVGGARGGVDRRAGREHAPRRDRGRRVHRRTPRLRLARAARRTRRQPGSVLRRLRGPVPDRVGRSAPSIPVLIPIPLRVGFLVIAGAAGFALFSYVAGQRAAHRTHAEPPGPGADEVVADRTRPARPHDRPAPARSSTPPRVQE